METKVNYMLVGLFVLVLGACFIASSFFLGFGSGSKQYDRYLVFMTESVAGLSTEAPVKYRGVEIGRVAKISLDHDQPERIRLLLEVEKDIPIRQDVVATLETQGITGLAYIDLSGESKQSPLLQAKDSEPYAEIQSGPSLIFRLEEQIPLLIASLTATSESIHDFFAGPANQKINSSLSRLDSMLGSLSGQTDAMSQTIESATHAMQQSSKASDSLPELLQKLSEASDGLRQMADEVRRQSKEIGDATVAGSEGIRGVADESGQQLRMISTDFKRLIQRFEKLAGSLEQNPDGLLFGRPRAPLGPGEKETNK